MTRPVQKFAPVAIALHWIIALGVVLSVLSGLGYVFIDDTRTGRLSLEIHQSLGILILLLAIIRLYWRLTHTPPPPPEGYTLAQRIAAIVTHLTLYLFIVGMPISGYIGLAARGRDIPVFGVVNLPLLAPRNFDLSGMATTIHFYSQYALYALVVVHVAAALYHHFVLRDDVMQRMLPGDRTRLRGDAV